MIVRDFTAWIGFIDGRMRAPLIWGWHDCVAFSAAAAGALTGEDYFRPMACNWTTEAGAARILKRRGGLKAATDKVLRRVARAKAHRGDIGLVVLGGRESLVVIEGDLVVGPGVEGGLVRLQRTDLVAAWSLDGQPRPWHR